VITVLAVVCAAAGWIIGWQVRPLVDRVIAERSEDSTVSGRSRFLAPVTAAVFAATTLSFGLSWPLPAYLTLAGFLVPLTFIDLDTKTLPRRIVWTAGAAGVGLLSVAAVAIGEPERLVSAAIGAAFAFVLLLVLHIVARGGFGFGDVRLGAVLGWYVGWLSVPTAMTALLAAFVLSAVVSVVLMVAGRAGRRTEVPFGPFLAAAAVIVLLSQTPTF
jgi:leader peptidase (prepilin peptidase) / N-methyltransferase